MPPLLRERREYLDARANPFFEHVDAAFWIARQAGRDVGRVAAIRDEDWQRFHGDRAGSFGMFDSPRDPAVAGALLDAAMSWLREKGVDVVLGPFDLSTNYTTGALVAGFESDPFIDMPYNPPYYDELLTGHGYEKEKDLWQWALDPRKATPERVARLAKRTKQRRMIEIRRLNIHDWAAEIDWLLDLYNDIWAKNWGFVPLRERELRHIADNLRFLIRPELALAAEIDGKPVAFALAVPNINPILKKLNGRLLPFGAPLLLWHLRMRSTVDSIRLMLLGIRLDYRSQGIDSLLFYELLRTTVRLGVRSCEIGWTAEDNLKVNRAIEAMGGRRVKTYRVYRIGL